MSHSKDSLQATLDAYRMPLIIVASGLIISVLASFPLLYYPAVAHAEQREAARTRLTATLLEELESAVALSAAWRDLSTESDFGARDAALGAAIARHTGIRAITLQRHAEGPASALTVGDRAAGDACEEAATDAGVFLARVRGGLLGCWHRRGSGASPDTLVAAFDLTPVQRDLAAAQLHFGVWTREGASGRPLYLDHDHEGIAERSVRTYATHRHPFPAPFDGYEFSIWAVPELAFSEYLGAWLVLLAGLGVTALLGGHSFRQARHNALLARRAQLQTLELERSNEELEKFASAASHDLRGPLRNVQSLIGFVLEDEQGRMQASSAANLDKAQARVIRMQALLEGLLAYARLRRDDAPDVDEVSVAAVVDEALQLLDVPEGVVVDVAPTLPTLVTAQAPLALVFRNLLANAIKFVDPARGRITVEGELTAAGGVFRVADNGPGISDANKSRVFELFRSVHTPAEGAGLGLGLAMVERLVRLHDGRVRVEDTPGGGCTMRFTWSHSRPPEVSGEGPPVERQARAREPSDRVPRAGGGRRRCPSP